MGHIMSYASEWIHSPFSIPLLISSSYAPIFNVPRVPRHGKNIAAQERKTSSLAGLSAFVLTVEYVSILALEVATFDMIWQWFAKPQPRTFLVRSFWDPDDLMFPDPNNWECEWCFTLRAWQVLFSQSICIKPVFFHCMDIKEAVRELRNRGLNCWSRGSTVFSYFNGLV